MKANERIGLIALVVFFITLTTANLLPAWIFFVIGLALLASVFVLFARILQHGEEEETKS